MDTLKPTTSTTAATTNRTRNPFIALGRFIVWILEDKTRTVVAGIIFLIAFTWFALYGFDMIIVSMSDKIHEFLWNWSHTYLPWARVNLTATHILDLLANYITLGFKKAAAFGLPIANYTNARLIAAGLPNRITPLAAGLTTIFLILEALDVLRKLIIRK